MSTNIDTILSNIQKNRTKLVELNVRKQHAEKEIESCEAQLRELGWDNKTDITVFIDTMRTKLEEMENEISSESANITEALARYETL